MKFGFYHTYSDFYKLFYVDTTPQIKNNNKNQFITGFSTSNAFYEEAGSYSTIMIKLTYYLLLQTTLYSDIQKIVFRKSYFIY